MIVLRKDLNFYYPKLSIRAALTLDDLYGDVAAPLMSYMSLETQLLIISLSLQHYHLTEDELYEIMDQCEGTYDLILGLYQDAGLITLDEEKDSSESKSESLSEGESITFKTHISKLLEQCMSIGMAEDEFYSKTLAEITRSVEAHNKQQLQEMEQQAFFDYQLANLIGSSVARLISKDAKFPKMHEVYGFLDTEEHRQARQEQERKQKLSQYREYMMALAKTHNKKADEVE